MRKILLAISMLAGGLRVVGVLAQSPQFEVASIKPNTNWTAGGESAARERIEDSPGSLIMRNVTLISCLKWAFEVKDYQISAPAWLSTERYDIAAKVDPGQDLAQRRLMLRNLLAARFQLKLHSQVREMQAYVLIPSKTGTNLHSASSNSNSGMKIAAGSLVFDNTSMHEFAAYLSTLSVVDRPVLDDTGIDGTFDFAIKIADNSLEMKRAMLQGDGPSIFTLIHEQLGLKLEARKRPIEVLVIDQAEKVPTEN